MSQAESFFGEDEIFFSTTDARGIICFANSVFIRVAKYTESEILGSPHNLIRHPDMPRAVFKLFWDFLNGGKPVVAYVKNKAKDGSYYWVLAVAFPLREQHVSIRIKPASPLFEKAQAIYARVLEKEKEAGMEEGGRVLLELLKAEGFESYDAFMYRALFEELKGWKPLQTKLQEKKSEMTASTSGALAELEGNLCTVQEFNRQLFTVLNGFISLNQELLKASESLLDLSVDLGRKALNLSIFCANGGPACAPLSVVAKGMTETSRQCGQSIEGTLSSISQVLEKTNQASFGITAPLLQCEMIFAFVQELRQTEDPRRGLETAEFLLGILETFSTEAQGLLNSFGESVSDLLERLDSFRRDIRRLELIYGTGMIEVAHAGPAGKSALGVLEEILKSAYASKGEIKGFIDVAKALQRQCQLASEDGSRVLLKVRWMREACGVRKGGEAGPVARTDLASEPLLNENSVKRRAELACRPAAASEA